MADELGPDAMEKALHDARIRGKIDGYGEALACIGDLLDQTRQIIQAANAIGDDLRRVQGWARKQRSIEAGNLSQSAPSHSLDGPERPPEMR